MVFPQTTLPVLGELQLGGTWTDITSTILVDAGINITRGRPDEASTVDTSKCPLSLRNDGRYSPRNPLSPYYGVLGRNTPLRISVAEGTQFGAFPGLDGSYASAPDAPPLDITGDIDIRIELSINTIPPGDLYMLASKYLDTGNQRSWALYALADGRLNLRWSADGTLAKNASSTTVPKWGSGHMAFRATMDVDSGGGTSTVTFYTSSSITGTWERLGEPVVRAEVTAVFSSTAPLQLGYTAALPSNAFDGRIYKFELRNLIGGTVVANPNLTSQTVGAASFADTAGSPNTWILNGEAEITNWNPRFTGEVSSWPQLWDLSGRKVTAQIEATGILRRLGQGAKPLRSALFRAFSKESSVVGYWPGEDGQRATSIASGKPGGPSGDIFGVPAMASHSDYPASDPLPVLDATSTYSFKVPSYTVGAGTTLRFFLNPTATGPGATTRMASIRTTGTAARWEIEYSADGHSFRLVAYDVEGTVLFTGAFMTILTVDFGKPLIVNLFLTENGANVDYTLSVFELKDLTTVLTIGRTQSGTVAARTVRRVTSVTIAPSGGLADHVIGHIAVQNSTSNFSGLGAALAAHLGENSSTRIARLVGEESLSLTRIGARLGVPMGVQISKTLLELLQECADADFGTIFEPRHTLGIGYRDIGSLYNQTPELSLNYTGGEVAGDLIPVDDDQYISNDVTASRQLGSSYHVEQLTGPLSTQAPPNGVGLYDGSLTLSLATDGQLPDAAGWRLHTGTVDEARYPQISINLAKAPFGANALTEAALLVDGGSRIVLTGLPPWLPPDAASQIVQGYTESLEPYGHDVTFNCTPESPFEVAQLDSDVLGHADTEGSQLAAGITSTATSLSVATTSGPIWTTDVTDLPIDVHVGGERMTVTAISGAASPQTFTVTRSVNGVVKAHLSAAALRLWQPMVPAY